MPADLRRVRAHKNKVTALVETNNDKDGLIKVLVPVAKRITVLLMGAAVVCEAYDYEIQEIARAKPPQEEVHRAQLQGRYRAPSERGRMFDLKFEATRATKTTEPKFFGFQNKCGAGSVIEGRSHRFDHYTNLGTFRVTDDRERIFPDEFKRSKKDIGEAFNEDGYRVICGDIEIERAKVRARYHEGTLPSGLDEKAHTQRIPKDNA